MPYKTIQALAEPARQVAAKLLLVALACGIPAYAQSQTTDRYNDSRDRVRVQVVAERDRVAPGETLVVAVTFEIDQNWKIYAADQPLPDFFYRTSIHAEAAEGEGLSARTDAIQWPEHKKFEFMGENLPVYEGTATAYLPVVVDRKAAPGGATLRIRPVYQSCDDTICLAPTPTPPDSEADPADHADDPWFDYGYDVAFSIVEAADLGEADKEPSDEALFAGFDRGILDRLRESDPPTAAEASQKDDSLAREAQQPRTFFGLGIPRAEGLLGLLLLALLSAAGGLVLNLTPCVLPVIPIKVMTILQHANKPGKNLSLGLWMALGVVAFWVAIGLPVAFFAGVTDPSQLFGIWWVTVGIGAVIALMGIGIMGAFSINLPQSVYAFNPKADTAFGSFLFGVMTAVLGLPCFGFVAGALLAGAATLPPSTVMAIFAFLGIGMALPYLVLSLKPSLVERIPRAGPASELVKQIMGLLLLAAAAYFIGSGLIALVAEKPYLGRQLHWIAVAVLVCAAAVWLVAQTFKITQKPARRATFFAVGLVLSGAAIFTAANSVGNARENWEAGQAARDAASGSGYATGYWNSWSREAFEQAKADGKVVVLDFTAEWCINCKFLKATVLDREPTRSQIARDDVVAFTVDLTSRRAEGWAFMRDELGQTGIPLLAIYASGSEELWQSNAYTSQQVIAALNKALAGDDLALVP